VTVWKLLLAAIISCSLMPGPAMAAQDDDEFETRAIRDRKEISLDPTKAYILLQSGGGVPLTFFREPTQAHRDRVAAERAEGLAKAREKYAKEKASYDRARESFKKRGRSFRGKKPTEPTESNFSWPAPELSQMFSMGQSGHFAKDGASLYLHEVPPGTYVFYGVFSSVDGDCACMGTVKFEAAAGKIAALQYLIIFLDEKGQPTVGREAMRGLEIDDQITRIGMAIELPSTLALDPRLPRDWVVPARFEPVPFVPNWLGSRINRIQPIPGLIEYDRDRVIDVQAERRRELEEQAAAEAEAAEGEDQTPSEVDENTSSVDETMPS